MSKYQASPLEESQQAVALIEPNEVGFYVKMNEVYYPINTCSFSREFNYKKLQNITYIPFDEDSNFKIVANIPNFYPENVLFYVNELNIQPINYDYYSLPTNVQVIQLSDNIHEFVFTDLKSNQFIVIKDQNQRSYFVISLSSLSNQLVDFFSKISENPRVVTQTIKNAIQSFPNNIQLQAMLSIWEGKETDEKLEEIWIDITKKWNQFLVEKDHQTKHVFAKNVLYEIRYYTSFSEESRVKELANMSNEIKAFQKIKMVMSTELPTKEQLSNYITSYKSKQANFTITLVEFGEDECLIRFKGLHNEMDGRVFRHKKAIQDSLSGAYIWQTYEITGNNWNTLSCEHDYHGTSFMVYPPLIQQAVYVSLDTEVKDVEDSSEKLFTDYCNQFAEK